MDKNQLKVSATETPKRMIEFTLEETEQYADLTIREVFGMIENGEIGREIKHEAPKFKVIDGGKK